MLKVECPLCKYKRLDTIGTKELYCPRCLHLFLHQDTLSPPYKNNLHVRGKLTDLKRTMSHRFRYRYERKTIKRIFKYGWKRRHH